MSGTQQATLMGGAAVSTAKRYWRIYITATNGAGTEIAIQEMEFRLSAGGADVTTTSTPITASGFSSPFVEARAIDNNTTNDQMCWYYLPGGGFPQWVYVDLGSDTNIAEVAIMPQNNAGVGANRSAKDFLIQSAPSTSGPWTTQKTLSGLTSGWTAGVYRTFSIP